MPQFNKESQRMSTCNRWDLQTLGSQPISMPKNLPDHCMVSNTNHQDIHHWCHLTTLGVQVHLLISLHEYGQ